MTVAVNTFKEQKKKSWSNSFMSKLYVLVKNKGEKIMNKNWWKAAGIRAIKTIAQTAIATIGTTAVMSQVNWAVVASSAALAGILSLLMSLNGLPEIKVDEK